MTELVFHPDIYLEIQEAYFWYEAKAFGLGNDFIAELEAAYQSIKQLPDTWPKFGMNTRRFLLTTFPYAVVYKPGTSVCFVLAVMHQSRKPRYWQSRAGN